MRIMAVKRYSFFVRASKKLCALFAFVLIVLLFTFPLLNPKKKQLELNLSSNQVLPKEETSLNKSYIITPKAIEQETDKIFLEKPIANLLLKDNKKINLISREGLWEQLKKILSINGEVNMDYDNYNVNTNSAILDITANTISSNEKVRVEGPLGKLDANGFTIFNDDKKMVFTGPVKAILYKK
jgi:lipopolysaccharide export system protein LptC